MLRGDADTAVKAADPDSEAAADGSLLPGPDAKLAGPTFEEWLATAPTADDEGSWQVR